MVLTHPNEESRELYLHCNYHVAQKGSPALRRKLFPPLHGASSVALVNRPRCPQNWAGTHSKPKRRHRGSWSLWKACSPPALARGCRWENRKWPDHARSSYHFRRVSCLFRWSPQHLVATGIKKKKKKRKERKRYQIYSELFCPLLFHRSLSLYQVLYCFS